MAGAKTQRRVSRTDVRSGRKLLHFPAKTTLFDADHHSKRIYLLRSGWVEVFAGHHAIVAYLGPGDFFGEKLFCRKSKITEAAQTVTPVTLEAYTKKDILDELQHPSFSNRLLSNLAVRIDGFEQAISDFVTAPAETRLARLLLRLLPARRKSEWVKLPVNPSNLQFARMIGTTRWRVSHFLTKFRKLGWLRRQEAIWINPKGLQHYLDR